MKKTKLTENRSSSERHAVFCAHPLQRPNYFTGRLLGVDDFIAEQEYHRNKQRRHNLHCHGVGVVQGLEVSIAKEEGGWIIVAGAGVAIDPVGNEVHLCTAMTFRLPESPAVQVGIRFLERLCGSVPAAGDVESPETMPAQVEEGCEVILEPLPFSSRSLLARCPDIASADVLPLARVVRRGRAWQLDRRFKVPRAR